MEDTLPRIVKTPAFYEFICTHSSWAPVFGIGTTRENLGRVLVERISVVDDQSQESADLQVSRILTEEVQGLMDDGLSQEAAVDFIANVLNFTAFQFVQQMMQRGITISALPFDVADI